MSFSISFNDSFSLTLTLGNNYHSISYCLSQHQIRSHFYTLFNLFTTNSYPFRPSLLSRRVLPPSEMASGVYCLPFHSSVPCEVNAWGSPHPVFLTRMIFSLNEFVLPGGVHLIFYKLPCTWKRILSKILLNPSFKNCLTIQSFYVRKGPQPFRNLSNAIFLQQELY